MVDEIKHDILVNYLYQQQCSRLWTSNGSGEVEGVLLRLSPGHYVACPPQLAQSTFALACAALDVQCAMTMNSRVVQTLLQLSSGAVDIPLRSGVRIQIVPTMEDLAHAQKDRFAAFITSEGLLVVWDDDALHLVARAKAIESGLIDLVWRSNEIDDDGDAS
ncbi:hypothetical protein NLU13_7888 [Sarocladium strictum]|uniref:DUF7928 domain-containing protein n=1 Tax=Sarocladium strictum TaxID=5046 RepID=A0AA39L606_SARSR|nr:hypothetical protein NLU13_7888 [Sarocladium strictum]